MGEDILKNWKENKFILVDNDLTETDNHLIVLTDIKYWADHVDELAEWCNRNPNARPQGMTIEISDDKTLTHFILRWS